MTTPRDLIARYIGEDGDKHAEAIIEELNLHNYGIIKNIAYPITINAEYKVHTGGAATVMG